MLGDLQCVRCGPVDQTSWIKKKKSVLAALYQKLKFLIASNWPKNGKREVFILGDPYYVRWIALQQTSRTKKEWPSSCFPSKIRGFESYYSLSCTHYHALMRMMRMRMMRMLMNHSLMTRENKQTNKNKQKQTNKKNKQKIKTNKQTKTNKQIQTSIWTSIKTRISPSIHHKSKIFEKIFFSLIG